VVIRNALIIALASFIGCSSLGFSYRYYYPRLDSYKGILQGPRASDDIDAEVTCKPDDQARTKCVVVKLDEFLRLKADYLKLQTDLRACQRGQ
jgi:hypothetical protein